MFIVNENIDYRYYYEKLHMLEINFVSNYM